MQPMSLPKDFDIQSNFAFIHIAMKCLKMLTNTAGNVMCMHVSYAKKKRRGKGERMGRVLVLAIMLCCQKPDRILTEIFRESIPF